MQDLSHRSYTNVYFRASLLNLTLSIATIWQAREKLSQGREHTQDTQPSSAESKEAREHSCSHPYKLFFYICVNEKKKKNHQTGTIGTVGNSFVNWLI